MARPTMAQPIMAQPIMGQPHHGPTQHGSINDGPTHRGPTAQLQLPAGACTHMHVCASAHTRVHTDACVRTHRGMCDRMRVCAHTHVHVYVPICTRHTQTLACAHALRCCAHVAHACMHIYMHAHLHACSTYAHMPFAYCTGWHIAAVPLSGRGDMRHGTRWYRHEGCLTQDPPVILNANDYAHRWIFFAASVGLASRSGEAIAAVAPKRGSPPGPPHARAIFAS